MKARPAGFGGAHRVSSQNPPFLFPASLSPKDLIPQTSLFTRLVSGTVGRGRDSNCAGKRSLEAHIQPKKTVVFLDQISVGHTGHVVTGSSVQTVCLDSALRGVAKFIGVLQIGVEDLS